jgi:chemotaxis protein methyltransferase CheR
MTSFDPDNLGLAAVGMPLLRDLIHERTGLYYENGRCETLGERLAPLVIARGFHSYLDFYYLLKYDERSDRDWRSVMDALSVPETYFWREIDQIRALSDHVLPTVLKSTIPGDPVRIWSAPCASGEEPLTIAIMLNEAGWFNRAPIEIHASDGSPAAIAKARAGRYRGRAFRALPPEIRERYFTSEGDDWMPIPELSSRIRSWSVVNLMDRAAVDPFAQSPIIFCRNAFIYFSSQGVKEVVSHLADRMPSPGYLFVGASESLLNATDRFALVELGGAFGYLKR